MNNYFKALLVLFLAFIFTVFNLSKIFSAEDNSQNSILIPDYKLIDINTISAWITNYGSFFRHPTTGNAGFEWPAGGGTYAIYASGMWISAKINNNVHMACAEFSYEFQPGKILSPGIWGNPNDPRYQLYKVNAGDTLPFEAIQDGAPEYFPGDQFLWCVYNDADSASHVFYHAKPLSVEVQQSFFGFNQLVAALGNTVFGRWVIINKSNNNWDSTYISIWSDPFLGYADDDLIGSDTTLSLMYDYNSTNFDNEYGSAPPAVGYIFLQGPIVSSPGDTAIFLGKEKFNYRNLPLSSFMYYFISSVSPDGIPGDFTEARLCQSAHWRDGTHLTLGGTGYGGIEQTNFAFPGDPETSSGWLDPTATTKRFLINVGPIDIAAGDTQEVVFATTIARGTDNLNSVTLLKQYANIVINYYDQNLATGIENEIEANTPSNFVLYQNYPNPFNPSTTIEFSIPHTEFVTLKVYNILGENVSTLVSKNLNAGSYKYEWDAVGLASGVYIYQLESGKFKQTRKMLLVR